MNLVDNSGGNELFGDSSIDPAVDLLGTIALLMILLAQLMVF